MCQWTAKARSAVWALLWWGLAWAWAPAQAQPPAPHAIWMWEEDSYALLEDPARAREALRFLRRQGIGTVYLYADAHEGRNLLLEQPQRYAQLITQWHAQGMQVHALLGSWPLHTERYIFPEHRAAALQMVQRVLDYNQAAAPAAQFDGINLDIEPHVLDDWSSHRQAYLQMFMDLSEAWMALKRASGQTLQIGPAIAFWLDGIEVSHAGKTQPASAHLQDIYDHVVLMDYRNRALGPDGIVSHAQDEIAHARRIGKRVMLGVEVSPAEPRKLSFHGLSAAQMAHELGLTQQAFAGNPAFAGFVLHHYSSYRRWLGQ